MTGYDRAKQQLAAINEKSSYDDYKAARQTEYQITDIRVSRLEKEPVQGNYDFAHLSKIHEKIFEHLYDHAGQARTDNFRKMAPNRRMEGNFADHQDAKVMVDQVSQQLHDKNYLKGLDQKQFIEELTPIYSQLNHAHPFEEGNGRATQTMIKQLAKEAGYQLNFEKLDKNDWANASAKAIPHSLIHESVVRIPGTPDTKPLQQQLAKAVELLDRKRERPTVELPKPGRTYEGVIISRGEDTTIQQTPTGKLVEHDNQRILAPDEDYLNQNVAIQYDLSGHATLHYYKHNKSLDMQAETEKLSLSHDHDLEK